MKLKTSLLLNDLQTMIAVRISKNNPAGFLHELIYTLSGLLAMGSRNHGSCRPGLNETKKAAASGVFAGFV
jgi:hypothetical protein